MTYVVGWKTEKHSFLCADMAITQTGGNLSNEIREHTVFDEKIVSSNNKIVRDTLPKIVKISDFIMLGFAGDVRIANAVIEDLIIRAEFTEINSNDDFENLLNLSVSNCLFGNTRRDIQLITTAIINELPVIFAYNHDNKEKIQQINELVQIGSLSQNALYSASSQFITSALAQGTLPVQRMLPCVTAFIQSYGVHDPLMEYYGVGGAITGAYLSPTGITWQENTIYILYDNLSSDLSLINIMNIDGTILTRNSNGDYHVFVNGKNPSEFSTFDKSTINKVKSILNEDVYKYVAFINKKHRKVVVLERAPLAKNSKYLELKILNERDISIVIGPELSGTLMEDQNSEKDSIPFTFSFLYDKEKGTETKPYPSLKGKFEVVPNV
jgi:hypothetical protein